MAGGFLEELAQKDPSWGRAYEMVSSAIPVSSTVWRLIRTAWQGALDQQDFIKILGFSRLNLHSLIYAAEIDAGLGLPDLSVLERALHTLGMRLSAVVLGINYVCGAALSKQAPPAWKTQLREAMTWVELGYRFGARASGIGIERGTLVGFSKAAGPVVALASDPVLFKSWFHSASSKKEESFADVFGCESHQLAAFLYQRLGFGHDTAIGAAIGASSVDLKRLGVGSEGEEYRYWRAASAWLEALKNGRNYPSDPKLRNIFRELVPPKEASQKNLSLEVLYTEIAKVRHEGSNWIWHLPKPSYEITETHLKAQNEKSSQRTSA